MSRPVTLNTWEAVYFDHDLGRLTDLAERLEVSRQTINAIETGRFDPSLPLAMRLAHTFGRAVEDIFILKQD